MSSKELRGCKLRIIGGGETTLGALIRIGKPEHVVAEKVEANGLRSSLFTMYRPPRPLNQSPVEYYRKHKCVDDHYTRVTNGRYYCNPAHCKKSWTDKKKRDEHLTGAFAALG